MATYVNLLRELEAAIKRHGQVSHTDGRPVPLGGNPHEVSAKQADSWTRAQAEVDSVLADLARLPSRELT